ncbi:CDK2 (cyclin-dependent kinase 2)-associated protein 1, isoform CRA_a, partial [Mus musculus]
RGTASLASFSPGSVHSPSTSMATSSQYRQLLSDYGPPSLGYTQASFMPGAWFGSAWLKRNGMPGPSPWLV